MAEEENCDGQMMHVVVPPAKEHAGLTENNFIPECELCVWVDTDGNKHKLNEGGKS